MEALRLYAFWGLLPLVVAVAASAPGRPWSRVQRVCAGLCVPAAFLLLAFAPRPAFELLVAVAATFVASALVVAAYLVAAPAERPRAAPLAVLVATADVAALLAIYLGGKLALGSTAFALVLLAFTALPLALGRWAIGRRMA